MPTSFSDLSRDALEAQAERNQKILVALFLMLGEALKRLPEEQRGILITEDQIRKAWELGQSPVRVLSEQIPETASFVESENWGPRLRFRPVLQFLNLDRVNFKKKGQPYPQGNTAVPDNSVNGLRRRVFDLG